MPRGPETLLLLRIHITSSCSFPKSATQGESLVGLVEVYSPSRQAHLVVFDSENPLAGIETDDADSVTDDDDLTLISVATVDASRGNEFIVYGECKGGNGGTCTVKRSSAGRGACCWWGAWITNLAQKIECGDVEVEKDEPLICLCRRQEHADIPPPPSPDLDSEESKVISCDRCGEWFHSECITCFSPPTKTIVNSTEEFVCPLCLGEPPFRDLNWTGPERLHVNDAHFWERCRILASQAPNQQAWQRNQVEWQWWPHQHGGNGEWVLALVTLRRFPQFLDSTAAQSPRIPKSSPHRPSATTTSATWLPTPKPDYSLFFEPSKASSSSPPLPPTVLVPPPPRVDATSPVAPRHRSPPSSSSLQQPISSWLTRMLSSTYSACRVEKKGPAPDMKALKKRITGHKKSTTAKRKMMISGGLTKPKCSRVMGIEAHKSFVEAQRKEAQRKMGWAATTTDNAMAESMSKVREQRMAARRVSAVVPLGGGGSGGTSGNGPNISESMTNEDGEKSSLTLVRQRSLRFDRSPIHSWGVYADEPLLCGDFIVEYKGELISQRVADKREKIYEARGMADYMFRIDANLICDATEKGSIARFINHSCDPNCYTRIFNYFQQKKIGIYALRDIAVGEELSYDYKFPIEPDKPKIQCRCGAKKCRLVLN